jgi:Protein of unknown function (DUF559)
VRTPRPWTLPSHLTTAAALSAQGVTEAMLRTQLSRGSLMRVRPRVFVAATRWPDDPREQHLLRARAEQVARPSAVLSHSSAAVVWGLPFPGFGCWWDGEVTVTQRASERSRYAGCVQHSATLPAGQVTRDAVGYLVTTPARTAVDLSVGLTLPEALVLLDAAARLSIQGFVPNPRRRDYRNPHLVTAARQQFGEAAESARCQRLGRAIALTEPCRESAIESLSAGHFALAGLPTPGFQECVRTPHGEFFPDCYWPAGRLIGEADGATKYSDAAAIVREKEREQYLRDRGYRFVRWLGKEIMTRPSDVVGRVARALDECGAL